MPKIVDRDERRLAIVTAAWRLIAARGIDGVNMRDLAAEAGYTNGALRTYFTGRDEILRAAFELVLDRTNVRIERSTRRRRGLSALAKMCAEIMPLTEEARLEARIAIALWQRALTDKTMEKSNDDAVDQWTVRLARYLDEAVEDGDIRPIATADYAQILMTTMIGQQVTVALGQGRTSTRALTRMIDLVLDGCRTD
ncbi:TetR/AcrR family transcriptional regulator [Rhodococcoides corynebacterioides]|uniref:TetR/AcrR family transcriptional regulator n=1 Tax=Rhodococcoides corynebacterioides TaxID=53972 RepID=UPI003F81E86A